MTIRTRWDHIHLRSRDPDLSAAFYEGVLGASRQGRSETQNALRVTVDLAGILLFIDRIEPGAVPAPDQPVEGVDHVALTVDDLDQALNELGRKGIEVFSGPTEIRPGLRVAFLRDPDRVRIELLERRETA